MQGLFNFTVTVPLFVPGKLLFYSAKIILLVPFSFSINFSSRILKSAQEIDCPDFCLARQCRIFIIFLFSDVNVCLKVKVKLL